MLTLEIRFLTGRYVATRFNDRARAEWPPHPARVYSALTAALYDDPEPPASERAALEWLAEAGAPEIIFPEGTPRLQPNVYVPPNDDSALANVDRYIIALDGAEESLAQATKTARGKAERAVQKPRAKLLERSEKSAVDDGRGTPKNAAKLLAAGRKRQPRMFPTTLPADDVVLMRWGASPPEGVADALDSVAARVARLGHSSSLVSVRVAPEGASAGPENANRILPSPIGDEVLRVPGPGQLARLDEAHARHQQVEARVLPAVFVTYADARAETSEAEEGTPASVFDDRGWLVFEVVAPPTGGRRTLLRSSLAQYVARAMRGLVLAHGGDLPATISGHGASGGPAERPHVAYAPLAHVGHYHASGSILGLAIVPPRDLPGDDRAILLRAIARAEREAQRDDDEPGDAPTVQLTLGKRGVLHLRRVRDVSSLATLTAARWSRPAARWATATPIALDKNPGNLRSREPDTLERAVARAEATIAEACVNVELPAPAAVWLHRRSVVDGAVVANRFMPFPASGNGPKRVCVHAEVVFDEPVRGPVILGAGRYLGLGLCVPKGK